MKPHVLLAEDNAVTRKLARHTLEGKGSLPDLIARCLELPEEAQL